MSYNYQGDYDEDANEAIELTLQETNKHCMGCKLKYVCKVSEPDKEICGHAPAFDWVWRPADSGNGTCKDCGLFIINDSGKCPECGSLDIKTKWVKIKKWR